MSKSLLTLATACLGVAGALHAAEPASVQTPETPSAAMERLLRERCARCHQAGSHEGLAPAGRFGNVLAPDELARDSRLVDPGNPDGSRLLAYLLDGRHPGGIAPRDTSLEPADRAALRAIMDWIAALPRRPACAPRRLLTPGVVAATVERWLKIFGSKITRDTRFITLANLFNECVTDSEMRDYRAAVDKALNGLSWREGPVRTRAIEETGAVLAVRLGDLGWDAARWDRLADAQPAGFAPEASPSIAQATGSRRPFIRADWFADAATRPPLYYDLLEVPGTFAEFARRFGVVAEPLPKEAPWSATSGVTGGRRTVERRAAPAGPLWIARDYLAPVGGRLETAGLAARGGASDDEPSSLGGVRALFTLPNGFLGSAIFSPDGRRRERVAIDLDRPVLGSIGPTYAGRSCLACHASGPISLTAGAGATPSAEAQDLARALEADRVATRTAMIRAGVDPDATLNGREVIDALAARYRAEVGLGRAAAELGVDWDSLAAHLATLDGDARTLAIRLRQGRLVRSEANVLLAQLSSEGKPSPPVASPEPATDAPANINLIITADKAEYRIGDRPRFAIQTDIPCYLTLISVNARGAATVLLPNDFDRENTIRPGETAQFPATTTRYDVRFMEPGRETVVALCEPAPEPPVGIVHKFAVERFTILGKWREFLAGYSSSVSGRARSRRKRSGSHDEEATKDVAAPRMRGRTAIVIEVRE